MRHQKHGKRRRYYTETKPQSAGWYWWRSENKLFGYPVFVAKSANGLRADMGNCRVPLEIIPGHWSVSPIIEPDGMTVFNVPIEELGMTSRALNGLS